MIKKKWTDEEKKILRNFFSNKTTVELAKILGRSQSCVSQYSARLGLKKSAEHLKNHRFKKGHKAWNKGMAGWQAGGFETRFKPGNRPKSWRPIGSESINRDGALMRKMTDTGKKSDWVLVHIEIWKKHFGEVPKGHVIIFKDRNPKNIVLENLGCVTRAELMRRNSVNRLPKDVALAIQLLGALNRKINRNENGKNNQ